MEAQDTINLLDNLIGMIEDNHDSNYDEALKTAIQAVKELEKYRVLEKRLNGISVGHLVNAFIERCETATNEGYERGRILTNEDADKWDAYKALGTVEELTEMKEQSNTVKEDIRKLLDSECDAGDMLEVFHQIIGKIESLKEFYMNNEDDWDLAHSQAYDEVIGIVKQAAAEYNDGWIPVESGILPEENTGVDVTIEEEHPKESGNEIYRYTAESWLQEGQWVIKKNPYNPKVVAWKYPAKPYQPKLNVT